MREKIMQLVENFEITNVSDPLDPNILMKAERIVADKILTLITEEIEKVENPYQDERLTGDFSFAAHRGFNDAKQMILSLLRPKVEYCVDCNGEAQVKLEDCPAHRNPIGDAEL